MLIEFVQYFLPYREASLLDVMADVTGLAIYWLFKQTEPLVFAKTRYRGPAKNANRAFGMLAMINLVKWGMPLTGQVRPA